MQLIIYFLLKDVTTGTDQWLNDFNNIYTLAKSKGLALYIVSPQVSEADAFFNEKNNFHIPIFSLDATAFKTAARTSPELYLMKGPVVVNKWGRADLNKALK